MMTPIFSLLVSKQTVVPLIVMDFIPPSDAAMLPLQILFWSVSFFLGLCFGSFANVMGLRLLKEEEFVSAPSHCPQCKRVLKWYENIPLLSFVMQGGKCRGCQKPISVQYPLIELLSGTLFWAVAIRFGHLSDTLDGSGAWFAVITCFFLFLLVFNLIVILITDWRESVIFILNSLSLVPAGLLYNGLGFGQIGGSFPLTLGALSLAIPNGLIDAVMGILVAVAVFEGLILLSKLAFGTEGFGHGDTHLMMGVGAFLGWKLCLLSIFLGFIVQLVPAVPLMIYQWVKGKQWTPLISGGVATGFALLPLLLGNLPVFSSLAAQNMMLYSATMLGCIALSLVGLGFFLKSVKQQESFTYLPLGPALVIASLACLFWGETMLKSWFN